MCISGAYMCLCVIGVVRAGPDLRSDAKPGHKHTLVALMCDCAPVSRQDRRSRTSPDPGHEFGLADIWVWKAVNMCTVDKITEAGVGEDVLAKVSAIAAEMKNSTPSSLTPLVALC